LPSPMLLPLLRRVVPTVRGLRFQAVHTEDVADAYVLAIRSKADGAFNIASEPVFDQAELESTLGGRALPIPPDVAGVLIRLGWRLRLQPSEPGWLDLGLHAPLLDTRRAQGDLGWSPSYSGHEALLELIEGLTASAGAATPPLDPRTAGPLRVGELRSGVGSRESS